MNLTKEDLSAIRVIVEEVVDGKFVGFEAKMEALIDANLEEKFVGFKTEIEALIDAKLEEKFAPIREAIKLILKTQIEVVEKINWLETKVNYLCNMSGSLSQATN